LFFWRSAPEAAFKPRCASAEDNSGEFAVSDAETEAWNRARTRRVIEIFAAIASGGILITMVCVFYSILTR
jgi:hypothetical protein